MVVQLGATDGGQRRVGFAQTHAVGQYAAAMLVDLVNGTFDAVLLAVEQRLPDVSAMMAVWSNNAAWAPRKAERPEYRGVLPLF